MKPTSWLLALLILTACGNDAIGNGPEAAPDDGATTGLPSAADDQVIAVSLEVEDSCGYRFVMRDRAGLMRLTVTVPYSAADGLESGRYPVGDGGWNAQIEVGSRLTVWPCHDVGTDFDTERVDQVLAVVVGEVELVERIPPSGSMDGGEVPGTHRAWLRSPVVQLGNGSTVEMDDIELVSSAWGFLGG